MEYKNLDEDINIYVINNFTAAIYAKIRNDAVISLDDVVDYMKPVHEIVVGLRKLTY